MEERNLPTKDWVREGIITRDQARAIEAHEDAAPPPGILRWHPFWLHVTVFMATLAATIGAALAASFADFAAFALGGLWFLFAVASIAAPWIVAKDLHPRLKESLFVAGLVFASSASLITNSEEAARWFLYASVPLLSLVFLIDVRPGVRAAGALAFLIALAGTLNSVLPDAWEPQVVAFVVAAGTLLLLAWNVPVGAYRRGAFFVAALLGVVGLGSGVYAAVQGSAIAIVGAALSAAYLVILWAAWTERVPPVTIPRVLGHS